MELAFVLLFVLLGTGAILYAGLHTKSLEPSATAGTTVDEADQHTDVPTAPVPPNPVAEDDGRDHVDRTD